MTDIDILHELLQDSAKVSFVENNEGKEVILSESQQPDSSLTIYGLPENVLIIKADKFGSPDSIFKSTKGVCKRADYIIISEFNGRKAIVYIEMKAKRKEEWEIIQQLKGAQCFIAYCRAIGQTFWEQKNFLENYQNRFVSFAHTRICKQKTRTDITDISNSDPDKLIKISFPKRIKFNRLLRAKENK